MTFATILSIIFGIISVIAVFASYYFNIKSKIQEAAEDAINAAEELDAIGAEKMKAAVDYVYGLIPAAFKPFLTKEAIQQVIQFTFDRMKEYALKQK